MTQTRINSKDTKCRPLKHPISTLNYNNIFNNYNSITTIDVISLLFLARQKEVKIYLSHSDNRWQLMNVFSLYSF